MKKYGWEDISDMLTPDGKEAMVVGKVLIFRNGDKERSFKVMGITKQRVWVKEITLYRPDDMDIVNLLDGKASQ